MSLELLGHAALIIESRDGSRLLIDPYESGGFGGKMAYAPITRRIDFVACTHDHLDHCAWHMLEGDPEVLDDSPHQMAGPFDVRRHTLEHDEYGGRRFGGEVDALRVEVDGVVYLHLSDVGHSPGIEDIEALRGVDVLCVPVGGFYTIGATQAMEWCERLGARVVVPMHYRTPDCGLPIDGVEYFLAQVRHVYRVERVDDHLIRVDDYKTRVVVLPMTCGAYLKK